MYCMFCCVVPQGMSKAYRTLVRLLERQYGGVETAAGGAAGGSGAVTLAKQPSKLSGRRVAVGADATAAGAAPAVAGAGGEGANVAALLANPQTNAAVFLAVVMIMVVIWRLAFMQPMLMQAMRGVASAVAQR